MRRRMAAMLGLLGAAATTLVVAAVAPSLAATPTFTVKAGTAPSGTTVAFSARGMGTAPQVEFKDLTTQQYIFCAAATTSGAIVTGADKPGEKIARISATSLALSTCHGPINFPLTITGVATMYLNAVTNANGVTRGTISGIDLHASGSGSTAFDIVGSTPVTFANATQRLTIVATNATNSRLRITNSSGLFGSSFATGDKMSLGISFKLTAKNAAYRPLTVTSP